MKRITVIDSHTGGEPTRVVVSGGPDPGGGSMADRLAVFRDRFDRYRTAIVNEPRGSDVLVGALLCEPVDTSCSAGAIFFNNVGYLGMCGHGTIGLIVTLAHLGRIQPGRHRIETPVGVVAATLHEDGSVSVANVESHRQAKGVMVRLEGGTPARITGDVAWGGNWFYITEDHGQVLAANRVEELTGFAWAIRKELNARGFPAVDHVELIEHQGGEHGGASRNFVLCPGKAYDRSPCGTGTSARMACLAADGRLAEGDRYIAESIIGSRFAGEFRWVDRERGIVAPTVTGAAHVMAEATLLIDERDPYGWGIPSGEHRAS